MTRARVSDPSSPRDGHGRSCASAGPAGASSLAFAASVGPSAALRRAVLGAHLTGACGALALAGAAAQAAHPAAGASCAIVLLALVAGSLRRAGRRLHRGRLEVHEDGRARWQAGDRAGLASGQALQVRRWCRVGSLVWIDAGAGPVRLRLLLGRDAVGDAAWRSLLCWLRWLQRGGGAQAHAPLESPFVAPS